MATYLILNLVVLVAFGVIYFIVPKPLRWRRVLAVLIVTLLLTAVFDNFIIGSGIVAYNPDRLLGVYIGKAPIEDFFYAILAAIIVPYIWERQGK